MNEKIKKLFATAIILIACTMFFPSSVQAATRENIALEAIAGEVSVSEDGKAWTTVEPGAVFSISQGGYLKTGTSGQAIMKWNRGHAVKIYENVSVKMEKLLITGNVEESMLDISRGKVFAKVNRLMSKKSEFSVKTPVAIAAVRGTGFYLEVDAKGGTTIIMQEGSLDIQHGNKTYQLDEHKGAVVETKEKAPESFDPSQDTMKNLDDVADEIKEITSTKSEKSPLQVDDIVNDILGEIDDNDIVIEMPEPNLDPDLPPVPPDIF